MLLEKQNQKNIIALKFLSFINLLPLNIQRSARGVEIHRQANNSFRLYTWRLLILVAILYSVYLLVRLYQIFHGGSGNSQSYAAVHIQFIVLTIMTSYWQYSALERWTANTMMGVNYVLSYMHASKPTEGRAKSFLDMTAETMWTVPTSLCFSVTGLFLTDLSREHLLCSLLAPEDNFFLRIGLLSVDLLMQYYSFSIIFFVVLSYMLTFGVMNAILEKELEQVKRAGLAGHLNGLLLVHKTYKTCRTLQVLIGVFNQGHAYVIFACKICYLTNAIVMATYTIKFINGDILLVSYTGIAAVSIVLTYCMAFNDAFKIPNKVVLLKRTCQSLIPKNVGATGDLRRLVTSLAPAGIRVGTFSVLERESTPIFVGFVISQVASLLLIL